jgi:glucose/arabinose dehydrogenase
MRIQTALAILVGGVVVAAQQAPQIPAPFSTPSSTNRPVVVAAPEGARLQVPQGFTVEPWADGFDQPRYMLQGPGGEILLSDSMAGVVYAFGGGKAAAKKQLITGLKRPYGLALWNNYLYVAETESVKRYPYDAKALTAGAGTEVVSLAGLGMGHWTRSVLFDRAGQKMYVTIGSASNVSAGEDPRRAAINRYNPDGTGHEIFASGMRNPGAGLHWYPNSDTLWATVEERDALGDDLPSDYFTHVQQGAFYGWPYAYLGPHPEPRLNGQRADLVQKTVMPDVLLGAHVSALDFAFYTGTQFPAEYRGGSFNVEHGSWNRSQRVGYKVVFIPFRDGRPSGPPRDFLTGWMISPTSRDVWGRPVAVLMLNDGSLLISDDGGKKIWRVSYGATRS